MAKKILVVVDYLNDFVDGALGFPGADLLDTGIAVKVEACEQDGNILVVLRDCHEENYLETREGRALPTPHAIRGTPGRDVYGKTGEILHRIAENPHRKSTLLFLDKVTFGVSPQQMVEKLAVFAPEVTQVEFVGLVTNMCVLANICCFQACFPEAQMAVDSSLVASFDLELHRKTLDVLEGLQVEVF